MMKKFNPKTQLVTTCITWAGETGIITLQFPGDPVTFKLRDHKR